MPTPSYKSVSQGTGEVVAWISAAQGSAVKGSSQVQSAWTFQFLSVTGQSAATKFWGQRFDLKEDGEGRGANQEAREPAPTTQAPSTRIQGSPPPSAQGRIPS